jgi:hypothetical protein
MTVKFSPIFCRDCKAQIGFGNGPAWAHQDEDGKGSHWKCDADHWRHEKQAGLSPTRNKRRPRRLID